MAKNSGTPNGMGQQSREKRGKSRNKIETGNKTKRQNNT
jgi:hypothetical protein